MSPKYRTIMMAFTASLCDAPQVVEVRSRLISIKGVWYVGGDGSTRWHGVPTRLTTDEVRSLDVAALRPLLDGAMHTAMLGCGTWSLPMQVRNRSLVAFRYPANSAGDGDVPEFVDIAWTACGFGGERPWFVCPSCRERAKLLYVPPGEARFRCRACHGLAYSSQRRGAIERVEVRIWALQAALGAPERSDPLDVPRRPRGMRRTRYARLRGELVELQRERDMLLDVALLRRYPLLLRGSSSID
jgi:LSD1 subclass zinc finger protein